MTVTGDHGGDSEAELDAALLAFSPRGFSASSSQVLPAIEQVDLVPLLASLTGVPIPFSNLGVVEPALIPSNLLHAVNANYRQVRQRQPSPFLGPVIVALGGPRVITRSVVPSVLGGAEGAESGEAAPIGALVLTRMYTRVRVSLARESPIPLLLLSNEFTDYPECAFCESNKAHYFFINSIGFVDDAKTTHPNRNVSPDAVN